MIDFIYLLNRSQANATPSKTFYFGMDENAEPGVVDNIIDKTQLDAIDRFAESLMKRKPVQRLNGKYFLSYYQ